MKTTNIIAEYENVLEKLNHYYEMDLDKDHISVEDLLKELAHAMVDPKYRKDFEEEYKDYLKEISA